jgi:hypothetical protein
MLELLQITNDPALAQRCDAIDGMRLFVDLELLGKQTRQPGGTSFITSHQMSDVGRIKAVLRRAKLMVRVNPLNPSSPAEVEAVLAQQPDLLMLPMFSDAQALHSFCNLVAGRCPVVALLETRGAFETMDEWLGAPGLVEVFVGLNDLHRSLGHHFMFEPLADGHVQAVAHAAHAHGLRFGFGGIARVDEGLLTGRDVLGEHLRLGSQAVILSRTFHRSHNDASFVLAVAALRVAERELALRSQQTIENDRLRTAATIGRIAQTMQAPQLGTVE